MLPDITMRYFNQIAERSMNFNVAAKAINGRSINDSWISRGNRVLPYLFQCLKQRHLNHVRLKVEYLVGLRKYVLSVL